MGRRRRRRRWGKSCWGGEISSASLSMCGWIFFCVAFLWALFLGGRRLCTLFRCTYCLSLNCVSLRGGPGNGLGEDAWAVVLVGCFL